jgi:outer membrane protein assembly factor BamB
MTGATGLLILGLAAAAGAQAVPDPSTWAQFKRDARRSGDNPQATLDFPLRRTTAVRFPSPLYASPAVADGKVYIQDARGNVACIDAARNVALWTTPLGGFNNTSSPAVANGKVYVGSAAGAFYVLEAATGKVLTRVPAPGGVLAAPAVTADAVYFATFDGTLVKTDAEGRRVWSYDGGRLSATEFAVFDRDILFLAGTNNTLFHRLRDQGERVEVVSKTPAPGNCCPVGGPAFVTAETFAFQSFDSEVGRFYLMKGNAINDVNDARATPSVRGSLVYRGDKCFTAAPNLKPAWRADPSVLYDGGFHSSPALGRDVLAVGSELGVVHFFALEGKDPVRKPVWQFRTLGAGGPNGAVSSSPAVVDGAVYFGGEDGILYGLGRGNEAPVVDLPVREEPRAPRRRLEGAEWPTPGGDMGFSYVSPDRAVKPPFALEWKTRVWSTFKGPMIVADGKVFCAGRMGPFMALDAATGEILWKTHHPGVESRPAPTYADGRLLVMRVRAAQGDSPYVSGASGGPPGEGLWCHDAASGKVLWHQPMKFKYHFNHDGLAVHEGKVFVEQSDERGVVYAVAYSVETGREAWRRALDEAAPGDGKAKLPPRFSGVISEGLWCVSVSDRCTLALEPATGKTVWSTREFFITRRTRVAARNGVVVVFTEKGDQALDARTGERLWTGAAALSPYSQALTDRYLQSQGRQGIFPTAVCAWPVFANGFWYSHNNFGKAHGVNAMAALKDPGAADVVFLSPKEVVWSFSFLSNACPSPSPAYGRLYYAPNAEGVIYCFAPSP